MKRAIVVGCGLSGVVVARQLADVGWKVDIYEKRDHIGGNMYDFVDEYGVLVHKYGPHTFHTKKKELFDYICNFAEWQEYKLCCGAEIDGICTPTPFNFQTIDQFYSKEDAETLKKQIALEFGDRKTVTVVEALNSKNLHVRSYAEFLFEKDYSLYTAKQWGVSPSEIDPSILKRVPLRLNYDQGYFDDEFQVMPKTTFTDFFKNLLNHPNIRVELGIDALKHLSIASDGLNLKWDEEIIACPVVYTGAIDELFNYCEGELPYRSLRFEWKHADCDSIQEMAVVAYPQAEGYTRIVEFKKLPYQKVKGTSYEIEYPLAYVPGKKNEPYYPVLTKDSLALYQRYSNRAAQIKNLYCCGRLANFKYYNMDQALENALCISSVIAKNDV